MEKVVVSFCKIIVLIYCAIPIMGAAQSLTFPQSPIIFYSHARHSFCALDESGAFLNQKPGSPWKKQALLYQKDIDYKTLRSDFIPVSTTKGDFFVVGGCGMMYQWKGDSIVRIDESFRHKNQFGSIIWVKEDTIFMTGGYGFFESTNITTYFDWDTKGWFHRKCGGDVPPTFSGGMAFKNGNELIFIGGRSESINGFKDIRQVRKLDTQNWQWKVGSEVSLPWNPDGQSAVKYIKNGAQLARNLSTLMEYDSQSNEMVAYASEKFLNIAAIVPQDDIWMVCLTNHNFNSYDVQLVNKQAYLGESFDRYPLFQVEMGGGRKVAMLVVMGIFILGIWVWRRPVRIQAMAPAEHTNPVEKVEWAWGDLELAMMNFFFEIGEQGFETTELNHFFDYGSPNFDTLKKRRDLKMREMRRRLSSITGIPTEEVFLEKRLESDRRVKKLYLNPGIKRENAGISL